MSARPVAPDSGEEWWRSVRLMRALVVTLCVGGGWAVAIGVALYRQPTPEAAIDAMRAELVKSVRVNFPPEFAVTDCEQTPAGWWIKVAASPRAIQGFLDTCDGAARPAGPRLPLPPPGAWPAVVAPSAVASADLDDARCPDWWAKGAGAQAGVVIFRDGGRLRYVIATDRGERVWVHVRE